MLVPEIALAVPLIDRLRHDLGVDAGAAPQRAGRGRARRRVAAHPAGRSARSWSARGMAVLAPLADLGVVVVDEEHDAAYKSDRTPRYQARDVALELGRLAGAPVVLGSATPDIVSVGRARAGELDARPAAGARRGRRADGWRSWTCGRSWPRATAACCRRRSWTRSRALDRDGGRAGHPGHQPARQRVGRALPRLRLRPGLPGLPATARLPRRRRWRCAAITAARRRRSRGAARPAARARIRYLGGGTERVEQEVRVRFPELRVGRLDRDVVERRGAAARVVDASPTGRLDVLVGTSLVTKGLDIPEVTLVGVVSADIALNLPDERAAERTWQLLAQAVGRAGRGERARVGRIIQTYLPGPSGHRGRRGAATRGAFVEAELERRAGVTARRRSGGSSS